MSRRSSRTAAPRHDLRAKATEGGRRTGGIDPAAVEAARAVIRARAPRYLDAAAADIAALEAELDAAGERGAEALAAIARRARTMRAHGTTYGYPLITRLAGALYDFCVNAKPDEGALEVVQAHIEALKAVAAGPIAGDGGHVGRELVDAVTAAAEVQG